MDSTLFILCVYDLPDTITELTVSYVNDTSFVIGETYHENQIYNLQKNVEKATSTVSQ